MQRLFLDIKRAASNKINVLILGETGTGKDLVAKIIHILSNNRHSPAELPLNKAFTTKPWRSSGGKGVVILNQESNLNNFYNLNLNETPESLIESELFGFEKGSFTGAVDKHKSPIELISGGTCLINEICDLPFYIQSKLLTIIEDKEFKPIGSNKKVKVNVRFLFATNKDIFKMVEEKRFRDDLFFRIAGEIIQLPPLRKRREDIPYLTEYFIKNLFREQNIEPKQITNNAMNFLINYEYPGNIRQLKTIIERAIVKSLSKITINDILSSIPMQNNISHKLKSLKQIEREYINKVLIKCNGNKKLASQLLQIDKTTLYRKLRN